MTDEDKIIDAMVRTMVEGEGKVKLSAEMGSLFECRYCGKQFRIIDNEDFNVAIRHEKKCARLVSTSKGGDKIKEI